MKTINPGAYYEAILQLRNPNQEAINCILNAVKRRKDVSIVRVEDVKDGHDFYISSQRFTKTLGKKLNQSFNGTLKESKKLYGMNRQTSRQVYRGTIFFKLD